MSAAELGVARHWVGYKITGDLPTVTAAGPIVRAFVNYGRWLVQCPWCPSAEYASMGDHRFFCTDCGNAPVGGAWVPVQWPEEYREIDAALAGRPKMNRNWAPGETMSQLAAENAANLGGR